MRCDLAAALLHKPKILFLDEPTIGLDVVAKENVRVFLRQSQVQMGTTVILTTHDLGDIQRLCRRIIIIDKGIVVMDGLLEDLRRRLGDRVRLTLDLREPAQCSDLKELTDPLPVRWVECAGRTHVAEFSRGEVTSAEVVQRVLAVYRIHDLTITEPSIEDVVREIYQDGTAVTEGARHG
jgi:ABC-2 type transport system ATP-binding protein